MLKELYQILQYKHFKHIIILAKLQNINSIQFVFLFKNSTAYVYYICYGTLLGKWIEYKS